MSRCAIAVAPSPSGVHSDALFPCTSARFGPACVCVCVCLGCFVSASCRFTRPMPPCRAMLCAGLCSFALPLRFGDRHYEEGLYTTDSYSPSLPSYPFISRRTGFECINRARGLVRCESVACLQLNVAARSYRTGFLSCCLVRWKPSTAPGTKSTIHTDTIHTNIRTHTHTCTSHKRNKTFRVTVFQCTEKSEIVSRVYAGHFGVERIRVCTCLFSFRIEKRRRERREKKNNKQLKHTRTHTHINSRSRSICINQSTTNHRVRQKKRSLLLLVLDHCFLFCVSLCVFLCRFCLSVCGLSVFFLAQILQLKTVASSRHREPSMCSRRHA